MKLLCIKGKHCKKGGGSLLRGESEPNDERKTQETPAKAAVTAEPTPPARDATLGARYVELMEMYTALASQYMATKKKVEFSKLIFIYFSVVNTIVVFFTLYMVWETKDLSPLIYLIPSTAAEVATGSAFYYWKARAENKLKLMKAYGLNPESNAFMSFDQ